MTTASNQPLAATGGQHAGAVALQQQLAAVRAMLAPHLDRPGAARLFVLAVDLLLAGGGPCSLSLTDLTQRLGCARKSVLQALRLGEELGLLCGAPGPRVDGRRGPAPTAWALGLASGSETGSARPPAPPSPGDEPVPTGGEARPVDREERGHDSSIGVGVAPEPALAGARRQPVSPVPILGSELTRINRSG